jgi:hypothetical protein
MHLQEPCGFGSTKAMAPRFSGIALRKLRHDANGERFVVVLRSRTGEWRVADEYGELDGEAAWGVLADHGLWSERIALILDDARARFRPPGFQVGA